MGKVLCGRVGELFAAETTVEGDSNSLGGGLGFIALEEILCQTSGGLKDGQELFQSNGR